jgi:hypothetical protein
MVTYTFNVVGALSGNYEWYAALPFGLTVVHVSAVGSNASDATIKVGSSTDDDEVLTASAVGDSGTPAEFDADDFVSAAPHLDKGDVLDVTVDFDGDSGTAVQDLQVVITGLVG